MKIGLQNFIMKDGGKHPFPNEHVDPEIKQSKKFGLKVAKAIIDKSFGTGIFTTEWEKIKENRRYAQGRQNEDQYKKAFRGIGETSGDSTYLNLDWSIQSVMPKFVDILVGGLINADHKIEFNAIDPLSKRREASDRDKFFGKFMQSQVAKQIEDDMGVKLIENDGFNPESVDDIEMYMEMEYKQPVEIAMENISEWILNFNNWDDYVKNKIAHDLVENNKAFIRAYYDENNNIKFKYVDIERLITSHTDKEDYSDADYYGYVDVMTLRELRKRTNFTEEEYFNIARQASGEFGNPTWKYSNMYSENADYAFDDYRVEVLDFVYYTTDVHKWEKKYDKYGNTHIHRKPYDYSPPKESKYEKTMISKDMEVEYEGIWAIGTDSIQYGRAKNMIRPRQNGKISPKLVHKFIGININRRDGESVSMVDRMKPIADSHQNTIMKMRHLEAEVAPPGIAIDITAIAEIGDSVSDLDYKKVIQLYKEKGIYVYVGTDKDGNPLNGKPFQEMINGIQDGLRPLIEKWNFDLQQYREVTGVNEARDASSPDAKTLVGVQKLQFFNSNNATRELYNGFFNGIMKRLGEAVARMVQDKVRFDPKGAKEYENIVGDMAVRSLDWVKDLYMSEMGVIVQPLPDDDEIQRLNIDIERSIESGELRIEDAQAIRRIPNVKLAERYMKMRRKKYAQEKLQVQAQQEKLTAEREAMAAQASAEAEAMKIQAKQQSEIALAREKFELEKQKMMLENENKLREIDRQGYWKIEQIEEAREGSMRDEVIKRELDKQDTVPNNLGRVRAGDAPKTIPRPDESAKRV